MKVSLTAFFVFNPALLVDVKIMHLQAKGFLLLVGVNIKGGEKMRAMFIVIAFLLGFFLLFSGVKIVEKRMDAVAEIEKEVFK